MSSHSQPPRYGSDPESVLRVSEYFLRHRNFHDCKMYALQAQQSDSNLTGLSQIIAVADVLLSSKTKRDHYSILNLKPFCSDPNLIDESFKNLAFLLNPSSNSYPFADEAFGLVEKAWLVLSDPIKKTQFDNLLYRRNVNMDGEIWGKSGASSEKLDGFWTLCPYCYCVYQYAKVYEGCNLRCPNEECRKGFRGLVINQPPVDVLIKGEYSRPWTPFIPRNDNVNQLATDNLVEISDDSENLCGGDDMFEESSKRTETGQVNKHPVSNLVLKRTKKSVGKNTTKVMGTGNRVKKQVSIPKSIPMDWIESNW